MGRANLRNMYRFKLAMEELPMKTTIKRFFVCLLVTILLCTQMAVNAFAAPPGRDTAGQAAAEELHGLGLFLGSGDLPDGSPNFELDRTPTRGEALVMLVRLLGAEDEAKTGHYSHPFTDTGWADAYVGYAYANRITSGVSSTEYGTSDNATLAQFLTFVLRALGYIDVDWQNPYPTAEAVGLYYPTGEGFYRADVALICLDALDCRIKGQNKTLRTRLIDSGAIDAELGSRPSGVFVPGPVAPLVTEITVSNQDDLLLRLAEATLGHANQITVHVPNGQAGSYGQTVSNAFQRSLSHPFSEANGYGCSYYSNKIVFKPSYSDSVRIMAWLEGRADSLTDQDIRTFNAAQAVHNALVTPGMSEYDQVKAFHDWLVNNTEYDFTFSDSSYDAAGPLLYGRAVCDGYSKALDLLCYLSGIECLRINGEGNGGGHAWNKVKIDGQWYNIDVTWDDPVSTRPILRYNYFLISDNALAKDHQWVAYSIWPVAPADYRK